MTKTTFEVEGGKYVIVRDDVTFSVEAFRHGEPWTALDVVGNKLFHAMLNEIEDLKNYKTWYEEAIIASNEAGFAGMSAADVIRYQESEVNHLKEMLNECS